MSHETSSGQQARSKGTCITFQLKHLRSNAGFSTISSPSTGNPKASCWVVWDALLQQLNMTILENCLDPQEIFPEQEIHFVILNEWELGVIWCCSTTSPVLTNIGLDNEFACILNSVTIKLTWIYRFNGNLLGIYYGQGTLLGQGIEIKMNWILLSRSL